tara:strand:+ start:92 stop:610 length:519 start_codon:yes stop_codon:yes gene_type:complete
MGQEFFINSQELEDKIRQLLPSQGGAGASFDLSASTQIIPVIDLTESAQGSNVREDLQTSLSFSTATNFEVQATTSTVITNTGYWRIVGTSVLLTNASTDRENRIQLRKSSVDKDVWTHKANDGAVAYLNLSVDLVVFLGAGEELKIDADTSCFFSGSVRQIADIDGNLVNP